MIRIPMLSCLLLATITACSIAVPRPEPPARIVTAERPLQVLPADVDLSAARADLIATASDRFGTNAVNEALGSPTYLIAKRFMGMVPPPPPGAGPDWVPPTPTALLMKDKSGWMIATETGWRAARPDASAIIERVISDPAFWSELPANLPCPDYGASLLLLKVPDRAETVRRSSCTNVAEKAVLAALGA